MTIRFLLPAVAAATLVAGCSTYDDDYGPRYATTGSYAVYDYNHPDPRYGNYDARRYYRQRAEERRMAENDRIYRGSDGRYYCRRSDGTTGLVVGALAGGVLGNVLAPGGSETLGTLLGAGGGALIGHEIDRNNVVCR